MAQAGVDYDRAFNHLCHVLSLSQTGKPKAALEGMILAVCDLEQGNVAGSGEIKTALEVYFGLRVKSRPLDDAIEELQAQGRLLRSGSTGRLRLSPVAQAEVRERTEAGDKLETAVRSQWLDGLREKGLAIAGQEQDLWRCLRLYMAQVFRQHGALSVELLTPSSGSNSLELSSVEAALASAMREHPCGDPTLARKAIEMFFKEVTAERSRYVAQLLDGTFTFFALSIDEAAAQYITQTVPRLTLLLDTNFIFELLGLSHTDSTGDAARELIEFIKRNNFPFQLYMHGETLAEVERTIGSIGRSTLHGRTFTQELSRAAISSRSVLGTLSGVELAYHQLNAKRKVDTKTFLDKFKNVEPLLREHGIKVYREAFNTPTVPDEEKALLVAEYKAYIEERGQTKPYDALDHDITVWLFVQSKRRPARTTLHAGALFLTVDYRFFNFDRHYLSADTHARGSQSVIVPKQLLQVLRPYGKQSDDFDARFVECFGLAEVRTAHSDYGASTSKMMSLLATYEDVPHDIAVELLTDLVLRSELENVEADPEQQVREKIEAAVFRRYTDAVNDKDALEQMRLAAAEEYETKLGAKERGLEAAAADLRAAQEAADARVAEAAEAARAQAIAEVTSSVNRNLEAANSRNRILGAALFAVVASVLIGVVPWAGHIEWLETHDHRVGLYLTASSVAACSCWAIVDVQRRAKLRWTGVVAFVAVLLQII